MNNVEFDGDSGVNATGGRLLYSRVEKSSVPPKIIRYMLDRKIVRSEKQAQYMLLGLIIVCIVAAVVVLQFQTSTKQIDIQKALQSVVQTPVN